MFNVEAYVISLLVGAIGLLLCFVDHKVRKLEGPFTLEKGIRIFLLVHVCAYASVWLYSSVDVYKFGAIDAAPLDEIEMEIGGSKPMQMEGTIEIGEPDF